MTSMRCLPLLAVGVLLLAGTVSATGELSSVDVEAADDDAELVEACGAVVANTTLDVFGFLADALEAAVDEDGDAADTPVRLSVNATRADVANAAAWMQLMEAISKGDGVIASGPDDGVTASGQAGFSTSGSFISEKVSPFQTIVLTFKEQIEEYFDIRPPPSSS